MFKRTCGIVAGIIVGFVYLLISPFICIGRLCWPSKKPPEPIPGPEDDIALFDHTSQALFAEIKSLRLCGDNAEADRLVGRLRTQAWLAEGNTGTAGFDGQCLLLLPTDEHVVGGGACYDGRARPGTVGGGSTVPAACDAAATYHHKDKSKFPEYLEKIHKEVMASPEGEELKAREICAIADIMERRAAGEKTAELHPGHRRTIPIDSYRGKSGL